VGLLDDNSVSLSFLQLKLSVLKQLNDILNSLVYVLVVERKFGTYGYGKAFYLETQT
jgi:hypothetical protein